MHTPHWHTTHVRTRTHKHRYMIIYVRIVLQILTFFSLKVLSFSSRPASGSRKKEQVAPERRASGEMKASKWLQPSAQREGFFITIAITITTTVSITIVINIAVTITTTITITTISITITITITITIIITI